jgi:hypothetical protein
MFADMPLDNRTVDQLAACHRLVLAFVGPIKNAITARNDLIFRSG